jgi:uncharacterized iron-regulated membrane protein
VIARILPTLVLAAACFTLAALIASVLRYLDRRDARAAERRARPHSAHTATAAQDAAAIALARLTEEQQP